MGTNRYVTASRKWGKYIAAGTLTLLLMGVAVVAAIGVAYADTQYTVQSGDTLSGIASRYGITVNAIVSANHLGSSTIYAGQVLTIPSAGTSPTAQPQPTTVTSGQTTSYVVQSGDTLSGVAQRFGVTREALAAANNISPSSLLYVGQTLTIPGGYHPVSTPNPPAPTATQKPPAPTSTKIPALPQGPGGTTTPLPVNSAATAQPGTPVKYTVQYGDNLSSIAAKFNTTPDALAAANNLEDINSLEVGQVLTIIKGDTQSGPPDKPKPAAPTTPMGKLGPKWIELDLSTQMLVAYEGQTPVFSARMSSGLSNHPTVVGSYRIYLKYKSQEMRGGTKGIDYYDIPNVPNVMYFYSGYAIHGVWWHTNFGSPASHGCINLSQANALWMYNWAPMGTMVVSHR